MRAHAVRCAPLRLPVRGGRRQTGRPCVSTKVRRVFCSCGPAALQKPGLLQLWPCRTAEAPVFAVAAKECLCGVCESVSQGGGGRQPLPPTRCPSLHQGGPSLHPDCRPCHVNRHTEFTSHKFKKNEVWAKKRSIVDSTGMLVMQLERIDAGAAEKRPQENTISSNNTHEVASPDASKI